MKSKIWIMVIVFSAVLVLANSVLVLGEDESVQTPSKEFTKTTVAFIAIPSEGRKLILPGRGKYPLFPEGEIIFRASTRPFGVKGITFNWDFNSNGTIDAKGKEVTHNFKKGIYKITLTAKDKQGNKLPVKSSFKEIKVESQAERLAREGLRQLRGVLLMVWLAATVYTVYLIVF